MTGFSMSACTRTVHRAYPCLSTLTPPCEKRLEDFAMVCLHLEIKFLSNHTSPRLTSPPLKFEFRYFHVLLSLRCAALLSNNISVVSFPDGPKWHTKSCYAFLRDHSSVFRRKIRQDYTCCPPLEKPFIWTEMLFCEPASFLLNPPIGSFMFSSSLLCIQMCPNMTHVSACQNWLDKSKMSLCVLALPSSENCNHHPTMFCSALETLRYP
jgi:hypothetical protein